MKIAVIMDPIADIHFYKDSTLAMMLALQDRGVSLWYAGIEDLYLSEGKSHAVLRPIKVSNDVKGWFELGESASFPLAHFDAVLMRKDPPFNMQYIYSTYILEQAEREGVMVRNHPSSLRDCNEKLFAIQFPALCPPSLVTAQADLIKTFLHQHQHCVLKPLDNKAGGQIFQVKKGDLNKNVIIETLTADGTTPCMIQRFIPEIRQGDKRVMMIYGEPASHMLVRIPASDDFRGNIAAGAGHEVRPLGPREQEIAHALKEPLLARGLDFVGIDIIGEYLTEINVTSATGAREIETESPCRVIEPYIDQLLYHLKTR
ncbi:MAG: glutathione synthase [Gammaproteobacteria bacterium]